MMKTDTVLSNLVFAGYIHIYHPPSDQILKQSENQGVFVL